MKCGSPLPSIGDTPTALPRTSGQAVASLVLGVVGFPWCSFIACIPAVILGIVAKKEIRASSGRLTGSGIAIAGITLGALSAVIAVLMWIHVFFFNIRDRADEAEVVGNASRVTADLKALRRAIEAYQADWRQIPASLHALTTPVAYLPAVPKDVFAPTRVPRNLDYFTGAGNTWVVRSWGPDGDVDADLPSLVTERTLLEQKKRYVLWFYDPTNGVSSRGDFIYLSNGSSTDGR